MPPALKHHKCGGEEKQITDVHKMQKWQRFTHKSPDTEVYCADTNEINNSAEKEIVEYKWKITKSNLINILFFMK